MPPSRATVNAKVAQRFQRKQSLNQAKTLGNKFTEKQSHFERRREEEQVRNLQQQKGTSFAGVNEVTSGDGLLSNKDAWGRQDQQLSSFTSGASNEAPSPFELASRAKNKGGSTARASTTQSSATFGLARVVGSGSGGLRAGREGESGVHAQGTRSTRRVARFNLSAGGAEGELGGGAMGLRRAREPAPGAPEEGLDHLLTESTPGDEPAAKMTKEERFKQVVSNSRSHRIQLQKERAERDAETNALDKEINGLLHLLPKRNKDEEEREAFARSGTPAVRALLQSYKQNHTAKRLTIKASGEFAVTDLAATKGSIAGKDRGELMPAADALPAAHGVSHSPDEEDLDERSKELLARIRKGTARSAEEEEVPVVGPGEGQDVSRREDKDPRRANQREEAPTVYVEDDFDLMLNQMRLDTRRAHAVDRLLDESEEAELAAQQLLLEEDRRAVPSLGLEEKGQVQLSRGEWVRKGGDNAFQMHGDEDDDEGAEKGAGVYGDNVDIPSSYEGDSDGDDDGDDARSVDETDARAYMMDGSEDGEAMPLIGEDGDDPTAAAASGQPKSATGERVVVGSPVLDRILSELEALARSEDNVYKSADEAREAQTQRQRHFMKLLLQLHVYAKSHVLEVANTFRLVLIEAERTFLRGQRRALSKPMMLSLAVIANLFPMSDYRHEVSTPFYLFLCSTLMQMRLDSMACVHSYLGLCALLTQSVRGAGGKFVGESITALLNVLALQLPRSTIEPVRYQGLRLPIPLMERCEAALLATASSSSATAAPKQKEAEDEAKGKEAADTDADKASAARPWRLLETNHDPEYLILCAYHQLAVLADLYSPLPAFPVVFAQPFLALDALLTARPRPCQSAAVAAAHANLKALVEGYASAAEDHRAPLAMRTFRPRPIRLFEPLLEEREESAVKTEIRLVKREIREDKKRVMRQLTAEATVQRRAREKEQSALDAAREKRMHQVMGALQQQQHMMNTVDAIMAKAKSKSKKGLSGAPTTGSGGAGAEGEGDA